MRNWAHLEHLERELHKHRLMMQFYETNINFLKHSKNKWRKIKSTRKSQRKCSMKIRLLRDEQRLIRGF